MLFLIAAFILLAGYAALMAWYRYHFLKWKGGDEAYDQQQPLFKISLIIPARNEAHNIPALFNSLMLQDYPADLIEVILVDDQSDDATRQVAGAYSGRLNNLKILPLPPVTGFVSHKKRAIELGVQNAVGEIIVCTDADCILPREWLTTMVQPFAEAEVQFVAGPVKLMGKPGTLFSFQQLDFLTMQGITAASVSGKFHYMCNGANLAYRKTAFHAVNGFKGVDKLPTGDDMFLMYKMVQEFPAGVIYRKSQKAIVQSQAPATWWAFLQQRIRWASKAAYYKDKIIIAVLAWLYIFNVMLLLLFFASLFSVKFLLVLLILLFAKILVEAWFMKPVLRFFNEIDFMRSFPVLQPLHILYIVASGFLGRFGSYRWKGRKVEKPSALDKS